MIRRPIQNWKQSKLSDACVSLSGPVAMMAFVAILACFPTSRLDASTISTCPATVVEGATFSPASSYICSETDNLWLDFQDIGAVTAGETALPAGTIFHIDTVTRGEVAITLEPGGTAQFLAGATYSWGYEVVENSFSNSLMSSASSDYGAQGIRPTLSTTVAALNISSYNPDGTPNTSLGAQLGTLNLTDGSLREIAFDGVIGLSFTNTLTGIGGDTMIESLSNGIGEVPEPLPGYLAAVSLLIISGLRIAARRRVAARD